MSNHLISLASGVLPEFPGEDIVRAAQTTGYDAVGLTIDERWTDDTTHRVCELLESQPLPVLDVEVVWIHPGVFRDPDHERIIDIGAELGAQNVLIVSSEPDVNATKKAFEHLCVKAGQAGMRAMLEFLMITEVQSLQAAVDIVTDVGHPAGGVLIDALHLDRCGGQPADLSQFDPGLFPYAQLCDAPKEPESTDYQGYLRDAIDARLAPGDGHLPLVELLTRLPPSIPLSMEIRSEWYRNTYPEATQRAREILDRSRAFLAGWQPVGSDA